MVAAAEFLRLRLSAEAVVWSSTQPRAAESALLLAEHLGLPSRVASKELLQRSWGSAEGKLPSVVSGWGPDAAYKGEPGSPLPTDAESTEQIRQRLLQFTRHLLARPERQAVIVTHNETGNYLLNLWDGSWLRKRHIDNGEVFCIELSDEGRATVRPRSVFPARCVYFGEDAKSLLGDNLVRGLLSEHDLLAVGPSRTGDTTGVLAAVLGDARFGATEANDFPNLRTVARFGTGFNNVMVRELNARHISVSRTPGHGAPAIAEFALALGILQLRNVSMYSAQLRTVPHAWRQNGRTPLSAAEAVWGIVGLGHAGQALAKLLSQLGARVLAFNRTWPPGKWLLDKSVTLERVEELADLCERCDVISIHLASTEHTRGVFGKSLFETIAQAGRAPVLINTARGDIVDEELLLQALEAGSVSAAALDVWSSEHAETSPTVQKLRQHSKVIATPHIASSAWSARVPTAHQCVENIAAALEARESDIHDIVGKAWFGPRPFSVPSSGA